MSPKLIPALAACGLSALLVPACKNKEQTKQIDSLKEDIDLLVEENDQAVEELEERIREKEEALDKSQEENEVKLDEITKERDTIKSQLSEAQEEIRKLKAEVITLTPKDASAPGHADFNPANQEAFANAMTMITGDVTSGVGFVVADGDKRYLYTTAATLAGNSRLTVATAPGVKLTKFGNLEVAEKTSFVRLELLEATEVAALKLAPPSVKAESGAKLCCMGMSAASGGVTGEMLASFGQGSDAIQLDPNAVANRIGGPVIDIASGTVVAIITSTAVENEGLWAAPAAPAEGLQVAASRINRDISWQAVPIAAFLTEGKRLHDFDRYTRVVSAFAAMTPTPDGLGFDNQVGENETIRSALKDAKEVPVVAEAATLDGQMAAKKTRLGEADLKRRIASLFSTVASQSKANAATFEPAKFSAFRRQAAERSAEWRKEAMDKLAATASGLAELELKPPTEKPARDQDDRRNRRR